MWIELSWAWQFSSQLYRIIKIVVLDFLVLVFEVGELLRPKISVLGEIELTNSWRLMLGLELINALKIGILLGIAIYSFN